MANDILEKYRNSDQSDVSLSSMEKDAIGEILNISTGSAATILSTLINKKVDITTPEVYLVNKNELEYTGLEPALGVKIEYLTGLTGSTVMVIKQEDINSLLKLILGDEDDYSYEDMDELHQSAIGEIMNQMMGASATALADFLGRDINISTPQIFKLDKDIIRSFYNKDVLVIIRFKITIENEVNSEFMSIVPLDHTKLLVSDAYSMAENNQAQNSKAKEAPAVMNIPDNMITEQKPKLPNEQKTSPQPYIKQPIEQPAAAQNSFRYPQGGLVNETASQVKVQPVKLNSFDDIDTELPGDTPQPNFNLIMGVPLEVTVEIGRTKKTVKEILDIRQGAIIELDKQAGDPVDIIVNGQLIAKGDVVVIDDNFGVRITEIISNKELFNEI